MRWLGLLAASGLGVLLVLAGGSGRAALAESLAPLNEWVADGVAVEQTPPGVTLTLVEGAGEFATAYAPVMAGASYTVSAVLGDASDADVSLTLRFQTSAGQVSIDGPVSNAPSVVVASAPVADFLQVVLQVEGNVGERAVVVSVTFVEESGNPTATPSHTPTPVIAATSTPDSGAGSPAPGTATRTPTPTRTPTATRTSTPTRTATVPRQGTPAPTPTLAPTSTPTRVPGSGFGGLLANGDFESIADGRPTYWLNFGGEMSATGDEYRGHYAACLDSSSNSVKWMYQLVPVTSGDWYEASAFGRATAGEAFIRISWYESAAGNGQTMHQDDSVGVAKTNTWTWLETGPARAPEGAQSARVRLAISGGTMTGCFDDAQFVAVDAPAEPTPTPTLPVATPPAVSNATATRTPTVGSGGGGAISPLPLVPAAGTADGPETLAINEVMSDPAEPGRDGPWEWIELHNYGGESIDLAGWRIEDGTEGDMLPPTVILPGAYVVLAGASALFEPAVQVVRVPDGEIGNGLANGGDVVRLIGPSGDVVDAASYGENASVYVEPPPAPGSNQTLGTADSSRPAHSTDWSITLRPTPGEANVFAAPQGVAGLSTAGPGRSPAATQGNGGEDLPSPSVQVEDDDDGGGGYASWIILGGLGGISVGIAYAAMAPRIKKWWDCRRGR